jgi:8-oxo-dGTP pyrophosphatase MutT (NUDIX family)
MSAGQAARLRAALLDPAQAGQIEVAGSASAAVLVPVYEQGDELAAVFIKRHSELRLHAGQISFPGGRREPDDPDLAATALRETHEEIGLEPATVTLLGALAPTPTVATDIAIHPFVGLIVPPTLGWTIAPVEVEAVLEASLEQLAATHRMQTFERDGRRATTDAYTIGEETIWGATGRILTDLLRRLDVLPTAPTSRSVR